jgi:hypothetical protein
VPDQVVDVPRQVPGHEGDDGAGDGVSPPQVGQRLPPELRHRLPEEAEGGGVGDAHHQRAGRHGGGGGGRAEHPPAGWAGPSGQPRHLGRHERERQRVGQVDGQLVAGGRLQPVDQNVEVEHRGARLGGR